MSNKILQKKEILSGGTLWFTGLSGAGKSTLSSLLKEQLDQQLGSNQKVFVLDGDIIRTGLNNDLGFSADDRKENIRRIAEVSKLFAMSGQICFVAFISPYAADREFARKIHQDKGLPFIECHIAATLEDCEKRDVKGLYKKAREGIIKNFTGISDPYEEPQAPELRIETGTKTPEECAVEVFGAMNKFGILAENGMKFNAKQVSCMSHLHITVPQLLLLKASENGSEKVNQLVQSNEDLRWQHRGIAVATKSHRPFIIVGPSGAGKGTLQAKLTDKYPNAFGFSVSYTTRAPREGEVDGVNYNYITQEKFQEMIKDGDFIEYFQVHTNFYGTAKQGIQKIQSEGKIPLLDIDIQGTEKFVSVFPETNTLFLLPPSIAALKARLEKRGTETEKSLAVRLANSTSEIEQGLFQTPAAMNTMTKVEDIDTFNSCLIGYRVVNDDLAESAPAFLALVESLYASELSKSVKASDEQLMFEEAIKQDAEPRTTQIFAALGLAVGVAGSLWMHSKK